MSETSTSRDAAADLRFARDEAALTDECERRLLDARDANADLYSFRTDRGRRAAWIRPLWTSHTEPPLRQWAQDAARALLAEAST